MRSRKSSLMKFSFTNERVIHEISTLYEYTVICPQFDDSTQKNEYWKLIGKKLKIMTQYVKLKNKTQNLVPNTQI